MDKIASIKTKADPFDSNTVIPVRNSETVVYNRIDKAGSTTLISKSYISFKITSDTFFSNTGQNGIQEQIFVGWTRDTKH